MMFDFASKMLQLLLDRNYMFENLLERAYEKIHQAYDINFINFMQESGQKNID